MNIYNYFKKYYPLLGILLIFLSFPSYNISALKFFPFFAWFSYVPFFYYARSADSLKKLYPRIFGLSVAANLLTYGWMGSFGNTVPNGDIVLLIFFIPTLSVIMASRILLCEYFSRRYPALRTFLYPALWLFVDFLQSFGYLSFPWIYLGYSQYPVVPLIQAASLAGVYGITFLILLSNTLITGFIYTCQGNFLAQLKKIQYASFLLLVLLLFVYGSVRLLAYDSFQKRGRSVRFSLIQSCISPWENWMDNRLRYLSDLIKITNNAVTQMRPDLVIWSESATLEPLTYDFLNNRLDSFESYLISYVKLLEIPLLTAEIGKFKNENGSYDYTNSAAVVEGDGTIHQQYSKIHLAPIGEWFPYERWFPGLKDYLESMGSSSFTPGDSPFLFTLDGLKYACLICYEGMFPRLNTHYKRAGADFLVNITNDGWSDYYSGHMQHYAASVFRAVENGISYVRVGNTGYTVILDPFGRELDSIPILEPGFVNSSIDTGRNVDTVYQHIGDAFTISIIILLALTICIAERGRRRGNE